MIKEKLRQDFYNIMAQYPEAARLLDNLSTKGDLLLFGGAVRSYYENQYETLPRDFDIVIKTEADASEIEHLFCKVEYRKNRFDGYKVFVDGLEFDIWTLENTWAFKQKKVPAKEENLSETVFLNVDSIVYNISKNALYDERYKESMQTKILDVVLLDNPYPELNLLRALIFKKKYRMMFSPNLMKYFKELVSKNHYFNFKLYELQASHYGKAHLSQSEIDRELFKLTCF